MCVHHLFCTPHHTNLSLHPIQALSHLLAVGLCPLARRFDPSVANVVFREVFFNCLGGLHRFEQFGNCPLMLSKFNLHIRV